MKEHPNLEYQVVIPTKNGLNRGIRKLLISLNNQSIKPTAIYVVNNQSRDETKEFCISQGCKVLDFNEKINHSKIRNFALSKIGGSKYTLFTCDDVEFTDTLWVEKAIKSLIENDVEAISGIQELPKKNKNIWLNTLLNSLTEKKIKQYESDLIIVNSENIYRENTLFLDSTNLLIKTSTIKNIKYRKNTCEDIFLSYGLVEKHLSYCINKDLKISHENEWKNPNQVGKRYLLDFYTMLQLPNFSDDKYFEVSTLDTYHLILHERILSQDKKHKKESLENQVENLMKILSDHSLNQLKLRIYSKTRKYKKIKFYKKLKLKNSLLIHWQDIDSIHFELSNSVKSLVNDLRFANDEEIRNLRGIQELPILQTLINMVFAEYLAKSLYFSSEDNPNLQLSWQ
jgi:glycosyltransferase involved in cell wall biosynthesis